MNNSSWPLNSGSPEECDFIPERLSKVTRSITRYLEENRISGAVCAIARKGRMAHVSVHGKQNLETNTPMKEDSIFRIYSMTKVITSVCALMLYEEGVLGLDQPVSDFIPTMNNFNVCKKDSKGVIHKVSAHRPPTIYDLFRHMAGFEMHSLVDYLDGKFPEPSSLEAYCHQISNADLIEQPGTKWIYSASTDILGRIIEVVSGKTLDVFMKEKVFDPLCMTDTNFWVSDENAHRFCSMYSEDENGKLYLRDDNSSKSRYRSRPNLLSGGGGLVSSTADYLTFCLAMLGKGTFNGVQLLGRKTVEMMCADHLPSDHPSIQFTGKRSRFGLGVSVITNLGDLQCIGSVGEFGWGGAASTMAWIDPKEDMVTILMVQHRPNKPLLLEHRFKASVYGALA